MKSLKIIIVLGILLCTYQKIFSQYDATTCKIKIEKYESWKRTGNTLIIISIPAAALGGGLIINAVNGEDKDLSLYTGSFLLCAGIIAVIPGIIYHSIGKSKAREYRIRLENIKTGFYYTPQSSGFTLTYNF